LCSIFNIHPKKLVGAKMKSGRARKMKGKWGGESKNGKTAAKVCSADMLTAKKWGADDREVQTPCHNPKKEPGGRSKMCPGGARCHRVSKRGCKKM
jgi:hypothetical protein